METVTETSGIIAKAMERPKALDVAELAHLVSLRDEESIRAVRAAAYSLKCRHSGHLVSMRGIIEIGNVCAKDCLYCGIRCSNANLVRYRLTADDIERMARSNAEMGYASLVLQGGEIEGEANTAFIEECLRRIAPLDLGVTLSLGEQTEEVYARWKAAGAARYLLRIESSDPSIYARIHPQGHSWERRVECLRALRRQGYQVGTGVMSALPGQTPEDLARDIIFFGEIDADMIGMGPYIPHPDTPLAAVAPEMSAEERLRIGLNMIAATRLYLHDVNIAATTALQALADDGRERGILAGANVMMPNVTDTEYRRSYQLYAGKPCLDENASKCRRCLDLRLAAIGERVNYGQRGDSPHFVSRLARVSRTVALAVALLVGPLAAGAQTVRFRETRKAPPPERMEANVEVCGDMSRLVRVDVARLTGDKPPPTYSGDLIGPYDGFRWYVSRHYAITSDMDDAAVRDALALLELAWPQYGRIFGWRPAGCSRMAVVLASCREVLEACMRRDSVFAPLRGGLTQEGLACSYLYAGTPYQSRYILLHEATHLYQYCLSGDTRGVFGFLREGVADYLSSHIYEPSSRTLSVNVLDRAPIHNHLEAGLEEWRQRGRPSFSTLVSDPSPSRGVSVLLVAYLRHTPSLELKWRLLCERIVRDAPQEDAAKATLSVIESLYGPVASHDAGFRTWMESLSPTFTIVERDFDQDGDGSFVALPVISSAARLRINDAAALLDALASTSAPPFSVKMEPRGGSDTSAGFSGAGISFSMSNTWSGACVFTATDGNAADAREVPSAYMRGFDKPFDIAIAREGDEAAVRGSDAKGRELFAPFRFGAGGVARRSAVELFAQGAEARFHLPHLARDRAKDWRPPRFLQGMVAPPSRAGVGARWITSWRVAGPFKSAEDAAHASDGAFTATYAHVPTEISPPLLKLCEVFGEAADGAHAVLEASVDCDADEVADLVLGVSDGVEVLVNGERAGEPFHGRREWREANVRVGGIHLRKGANIITLRLAHADSVWLVSAHLE